MYACIVFVAHVCDSDRNEMGPKNMPNNLNSHLTRNRNISCINKWLLSQN